MSKLAAGVVRLVAAALADRLLTEAGDGGIVTSVTQGQRPLADTLSNAAPSRKGDDDGADPAFQPDRR